MGEGIESIRIPIETELQFQKAFVGFYSSPPSNSHVYKDPPCVRSIATYSGDWFIDLNQEDCS